MNTKSINKLKTIIQEELSTLEAQRIIKEQVQEAERESSLLEGKKYCKCDSTHHVENCNKTCTWCCAMSYPDIEFNGKSAPGNTGGEAQTVDFKSGKIASEKNETVTIKKAGVVKPKMQNARS
jgi:hypothetical protein